MGEINTEPNAHLNVVLLGKTKTGKSSAGNTILGRQAFISKKSSGSVTRDVAVESGTVGGITVTVYDTPGLFNTHMSDEEIQQIIKEKVLQKCESGLCVFLLVIKADRFTEEDSKTVEKIEELLGEERMKKTWILFTRGDELEEENTTIKEFINETEALKRLVQKYDQRYHVFNNKKRGQNEQVKMLLIKILKPYFDIQEGEVAETLKPNPLMRKIPDNIEPDAPADSLSSRRIVLLGKSGVGKSASGNTILGQREFNSVMSTSSVTRVCSDAHATVSGRSVSVVDTPGLFDTQMKPEELMMEIARSVYISSPGPHAFIIVFPVNMRFTEQEQQIPQMIEMMFGQEVLKYSIILFTHEDLLEEKPVEKLIEENSTLRDLVQQCGGRFHVFNNKDVNNRDQVNDLLKKIDTMIEKNGGGHYSNQMLKDAERFRREEEERRHREEDERKLQEEKQIQEEIERVRKETEERFRVEMAKVERQSEEEQRKQEKQRKEEIERMEKETEKRIRAEYQRKEEKRKQEERVKKDGGFMQFFYKNQRFFYFAAVAVGIVAGGAVGGALANTFFSGAVVKTALCGAGAVIGGAVGGGAASGTVAGAVGGAVAGAVAGAAVVGAVGGAVAGVVAGAAGVSGGVAGFVVDTTAAGAVGGVAGGTAAGAIAGAVGGAAVGGADSGTFAGACDGAVSGARDGAAVGFVAGTLVGGSVVGTAAGALGGGAVGKAAIGTLSGMLNGAAAGALGGAVSGAAVGAAGGAAAVGAVSGAVD